jgi:hypothetical protein
MARGDPQYNVRLPADAKAFIAAQAARNGSSQNSEIVRCIRDRMEREATTGSKFADHSPVEAETETVLETINARNT